MADSIAFILRRAANMLADTREEISEVSRDVVVDIMGGTVTGEVCVNHLVYDVMDDVDDVDDRMPDIQ